MRLTVINTQLGHICDIQRRLQTGTDPDGSPTYSWEDLLINEPCHFFETSERELVGRENVVITRRRLIIKNNKTVIPGDQVTRLVGYDGLLTNNLFDIEQVLDRIHETVCMLKELY